MNFQVLQSSLAPFPVFSWADIQKIAPHFHRIQLDRWEAKGYLQKIRRGMYCFQNTERSLSFLFAVANKIYTPSYVSLEMALKHYGLIPEETFQITSITTKKTIRFETPLGSFRYQHLKPELFWGYRLLPFGKQQILLAEPEKAILDYLSLHPELKTQDDFKAMRINTDIFEKNINIITFKKYLALFENLQLTKRAHIFLTMLSHDCS